MNASVNVNILNKEYQISCSKEEEESLLASAYMLHENMEKIKITGRVIGLDRIAVMAGLNLAHDLISLRNNKSYDLNKNISQIKDKVNAFLKEYRQLDPLV
ncbi:MAG: cell division protein ZapA [Piscirickettsiaceae bacterium]|nr:cell division protein ZapA [Piscirickettsiaceae bacterium]